ncbi:hypothetical protein H9P43_008272 [Blastocladiella emersonii ATCC 22665]|nr:hypothetical protein H9P43_008272 [Blastocladiella emersonii ATCC 22665]
MSSLLRASGAARRTAAAASAVARRAASTAIPKIDTATIPKSRFDNDPSDPQYYGVMKESGFDPLVGDYPLLKWEGAQQRSAYDPYWDPIDRRQFGETLHHEDELLSAMAPDVHTYPTGKAALQLASFFVAAFGLFQLANWYTPKYHPNLAASRDYSFPDFEGNRELEAEAAAESE